MGKYLYNGVPLPKLPDWDEETYPVAYIWELIGFYFLHIGKAYYYYYDEDGKYKVGLTGYYGSYLAHSDDSGWGGFNDGKDGERIIGEVENFDALIWTNTPILFEDGTIAEAASTPIPVGTAPEIDPVLMTAGYRLGCIVRAQRARKKEPVAYLYNGVRLPPLPKEWDRETYPFSWISKGQYQNYYTLHISTGEVDYRSWADMGTLFYLYPTNVPMTVQNATLYEEEFNNGAWEFTWSKTYEENPVNSSSGLGLPVWSNFDVRNHYDGTIYIAASDPIPVYE